MNCPACNSLVELAAAYCGECGSRLRARHDTLTGSVLADEYRIESKIAEGGFGSIYRAVHVESGLDVALKVMHAELAADPSLAARFRREAATLSRLHDPHTVATYDVGEAEDGTLFIAMELLHGENLHDRMTARGLIPWRDALAIIRDVCSALAEAHELGIVHRDLKPANIYLTNGDVVKLLDFGIAKVTGSEVDDGADLTRMGQTIGTLEYMAPEQIIGGSCGPRSDIYQLGVLMFEMITGRRPFADVTEPTSMITALLTQTAPKVSSMFCHACLPPALDALIERCLEREPEHRFTNVHQLVSAIGAVLARPDASGPAFAPTPADEERTYLDGSRPTAVVRMTALGPAVQLAPATVPSFDALARGSVAEGLALEGTGEVQAISEYVVEAIGTEPRHATIAPPVVAQLRPAPPSVSMAVPLPRRPTSVADFLARTARGSAPPPVVAPPVVAPPAEPTPSLSFGARVALWTAGLAVGGAAIGAAIAVLAS